MCDLIFSPVSARCNLCSITFRRVSPNEREREFPSVTACPKYCYELDLCDTEVGVVNLGSIFVGANDNDNKDGSRFVTILVVYQNLRGKVKY